MAVGVGIAKNEDGSPLEDVLEGALHLALVHRTSESQSDERPAVGAVARTPSAYADCCITGWRGRRLDVLDGHDRIE